MIPFHTKTENHFKTVVLTTFLVFFFIGFSQAQVNPSDWKINAPSAVKARSVTTFKALPKDAVRATISITDFKRKLQNTSQEIVVPTPTGSYETFIIEPTNIVAPEVAHLYTIKTFKGYKKDDPSVLIACDISDNGFHAGIYAGKNTYFVEPASNDISELEEHYIYFKRQAKAGKVKCGVAANTHHIRQATTAARYIPNTKRTYRLGIIASGEYSQQFGGAPFSVTNVLNALASGVNLINPIFLRDLGVEFNLVSTPAMVYINPNTDPFDLNDQSEIVESSHTLCEAALGINGFDIGHVVVWENTGGLASGGVVCNDNFKGEGFSGSSESVTTLWVDYVAHEIGHQFGAEHNFSSEECEASVQGFRYEPGEGSSIMAYANVCEPAVQYAAGADPYFHIASIKTMQDYIATTSCAITNSTGNSNDPVAFAQNNITIPRQTPFVLVGNGTDANDLSSNLTYNWVQYDGNGSTTIGSPDCNSTTAPLFRFRPPVGVPLRSFPLYSDVIAGNNNAIQWEKLPCTARTMNFSLTVRDNNPSFGRLAQDTMVVTVANTGPFEVIFPNGGDTLSRNTISNITWTVNGTDTHCSHVDILLSTDGGGTYTVIADSTANDGIQSVVIPNNISSAARILIRCDVVGGFRESSTFYDVSNANFTVIAGTAIVDNDNDGFTSDVDCNDNDATIGARQTAGTACNDGNSNTTNDVILADGCSCAGTFVIIDNDNDGFSSDVDCDDNNASINPGATEIPNNNVDEDCNGTALIIDNDNDGHNSSVDCNDNDATIGAQQTAGTACNDGNSNTENDVILADGCSCAGTAIGTVTDNDNDGFTSDVDCDDNNASIFPGAVEFPNNNVDENCDGIILVIDNDNDGNNSSVDCDDNDPTIGGIQAVGTPCNDGNSNTENDVILADGCSCAGTIIGTVTDNDNDGFTSDVDCDDNDASIGGVQAVGTPCNDGNSNTENDVILADGCSCAGTMIGTVTDNDNDGFTSDVDCDDNNSSINPGATEFPNNNVDENCDGIIQIIDNDNDGQNSSVDCNDNDPNIGAVQTPGTACDDGNANTINDIILANGCSCAGTMIITITDNDNDGFTSDVDCDDNNASIFPGAVEIPDNGFDEDCDGMDEVTTTTSSCRVPDGIQTDILSARNVFIDWNDISSASSYTVQVRYKGTDEWLVTVELFFSKILIFGPTNRDYEYRIRTNCNGSSSAFTEILEYSFINTFSTAASSRNANSLIADVIIPKEEKERLQLSPNPVRNALSLQYKASNKATLSIHHTSGQIIKQANIATKNYLHSVMVNDLEVGVYLLTIEEVGKSPVTKRFIKTN